MMHYGNVPGIDKPVSRLVQGSLMIRSADLDGSFRLLDDVFAMGCNALDTAYVYGNGDCERTIGLWMKRRDMRSKVVLIDKGAHPREGRKRVTPEDIRSDLLESLDRLGSDYIDLYLLHRDDPELPAGPIVEALNEHLRAGRIHAFGGSNWTHQRLEQANEYARTHKLVPFAASSPNFSLAEQVKTPWPDCVSVAGQAAKDARAWYVRSQMPLLAWSSLAGGFFSGRFRRDNLDSFTGGLDKTCAVSYGYEPNFLRLERAAELARRRNLSLPQVALAYVFNKGLNIFALVGCRTPQEFRTNLQALALHLSPEEISWLELESPTL